MVSNVTAKSFHEKASASSVEHRRSHAQPGKSCGGRKSVGKMIGRPASLAAERGVRRRNHGLKSKIGYMVGGVR
jgi:hypothetical protein